MVEETIKTIKETEMQAEAMVKKAEEECAAILENARAQAESLQAAALAEARKNAADALAREKEIGESSVQEALAEVEKDITALRESAGTKESEVISAVISALV